MNDPQLGKELLKALMGTIKHCLEEDAFGGEWIISTKNHEYSVEFLRAKGEYIALRASFMTGNGENDEDYHHFDVMFSVKLEGMTYHNG